MATPGPHDNVGVGAWDGQVESLEQDLETAAAVHEPPDVVHHRRVTRLTRTHVRLAETVALQEVSQGDDIGAVVVHGYDPEDGEL